MNTFNSSRVMPSQWGGHGLIVVSIKNRSYNFWDSIFEAFETQEQSCNSHTYAEDMDKFCKKLQLPEFLKDYYHFAQNFASSGKPASGYYRRYYCLVPNDELSKFVFGRKVADDVIETIRLKAPSSFANISEDVARRFVHVLKENEKPDLSIIYFMANEQKTENPGSRWNEYTHPTKYLLVDRRMNPIDVKAFMDVINTIVFDPKSES